MKFPFVTRKKYDATAERVADLYASLLTVIKQKQDCEFEAYQLHEKLELSQASERAERLKRLRAEGLAAFKDDRIRGALQLLYREESGARKAG